MHSSRGGIVRVGISGWTYAPWRGVFYPEGLPHAEELDFASRKFSTIEVNGSFYGLLRPTTYESWYAKVPAGFVFAIKGSRYVTHMKRLKDVHTALANFFASGVLGLKEKLGPILWQLPPSLRFDAGSLKAFFDVLPKQVSEIETLAKHHDGRLTGRARVFAEHEAPVRHALEVRHPSFLDSRYVDLLREYSIASCVADSAGLYPVIEDITASFAYVRLHGATKLYASGYGATELRCWATRIKAWARGKNAPQPRAIDRSHDVLAKEHDVFVYFDNDVKVRAPFDASTLDGILHAPTQHHSKMAMRRAP